MMQLLAQRSGGQEVEIEFQLLTVYARRTNGSKIRNS